MRFFANPDSIGCRELRKNLPATSGDNNDSFMPGLDGAEYGIDLSDRTMPCSGDMPATAMKASRQHLFTKIAVFAFLESVFSDDVPFRKVAHEYLVQTLPAENPTEISVSTSAASTP